MNRFSDIQMKMIYVCTVHTTSTYLLILKPFYASHFYDTKFEIWAGFRPVCRTKNFCNLAKLREL